MHYAHSRAGMAESDWEPLEDHLRLVAEGRAGLPGAAGFAAALGARDFGRLAGLWHDLGKYSREFQDYIRGASGSEASLEVLTKVDHSTAGAQHAIGHLGPQLGLLLAHCIAGHHSGLLDQIDLGGGADLNKRLEKRIASVDAAPVNVLAQARPAPPALTTAGCNSASFSVATFCRLLFSCLVDADYLATESWVDAARAHQRHRPAIAISELRDALDLHLARFESSGAAMTDVNRCRADVLHACRVAAARPPGHFSLTVPTGGGKTLSSLAFALEHAVQHELRRVIYAIPFTSIVEQTADVFRQALDALSPDVVLEHHSNLDPADESVHARLAAENWDAPLIVTTNVQLFESLFANKPSRCRKLHRIARSVIILDEAQTLPVEFLLPTLAMLDELRTNYGCTIVLCTATQPAVKHRPDFSIGLQDVDEIVPYPAVLFDRLRRVELRQAGDMSDAALSGELAAADQVLCIVNTKAHAAGLFELLRERHRDGSYHLSTRLCAAHRSVLLDEIRERLRDRRPCRVVSTQLIEAGVDIDFPLVYRAVTGLDSLAQAAGRCNREGRLDRGTVVVFRPEHGVPALFRRAVQHAEEVAACQADLLGLPAVEQYFRLQYWLQKDNWDRHSVMDCFQPGKTQEQPWHFQFASAAERYHLIPDSQTPVVVPFGDRGRALRDEALSSMELTGGFLRQLQRFKVGVYTPELARLQACGAVNVTATGLYVLLNDAAYDDQLGLKVGEVGYAAENLCI
jgi:CRISPR-associated endonuclease/helicase Cas3